MGLQVQALEQQVGVKSSSSQDQKIQAKIKEEKGCACCFWSFLLPELYCGNFSWFKNPNSKAGSKRSTDIRGSTRSMNNLNAGLFVCSCVCVLRLIFSCRHGVLAMDIVNL